MDADQLQTLVDVAMPAARELSSIVEGLFNGSLAAATAKAQIRANCAVTYDRLDASDKRFEERDRKEDERVAKLTKAEDPSK